MNSFVSSCISRNRCIRVVKLNPYLLYEFTEEREANEVHSGPYIKSAEPVVSELNPFVDLPSDLAPACLRSGGSLVFPGLAST